MTDSSDRKVIRETRERAADRVVLRVSTAEASGQRLRAGWGKERRSDAVQLATPRLGRTTR